MGEALADHHESTGAVFLDVAGQKERLVIALPIAQERPQIILLDITVARSVGPIPEIVVAELLTEQCHHALPGSLLDLPGGAHTCSSFR